MKKEQKYLSHSLKRCSDFLKRKYPLDFLEMSKTAIYIGAFLRLAPNSELATTLHTALGVSGRTKWPLLMAFLVFFPIWLLFSQKG